MYTGGAVPGSVEARRELLAGYAYAPLRAGDLLHGIFGEQEPPVAFDLYDGDGFDDARWLFTSSTARARCVRRRPCSRARRCCG